MAARGGLRGEGALFDGDSFSWEDGRVREIGGGDEGTTVCMCLMSLNCAVKTVKMANLM